ncbi:MAG TPA: protein phosphatase 2C domain-containing protein [Pseudolabrys sp.]|nr:protein phosphatase 2C domain-containing protein [Pseudolabrys sp.]
MPIVARISAFTHRGRVRARNEDTLVVGEWVSAPEMQEPRTFRHALALPFVCAVADGLGGHLAGEVASRHAARQLAAAGAQLASVESVQETLRRINDELYEAMAQDAGCAGMGTTVAGLVLGERLIWFNVGDSRLYRFRGGDLAQVSIDDAPPGPRSGLITQSLGGALPPQPVRPHVGEELLTAPARFLLCSDGLTDMLDDGDIADCLALPDAEAVAQLFDRAMRAGGADNVSIVVVSVEERT